MSDFLYTKIRMFGQEKEIMTPKHLPDAQWRHNLAYLAAYNDLRAQEADRREADGTYSREYHIDPLREALKIGKPDNPFRYKIGSRYENNERLWHPAMPVDWWHAPKPNSDRQALKAARTIAGKDYAPKVDDWIMWKRSTTERADYQLIAFEEVPDE